MSSVEVVYSRTEYLMRLSHFCFADRLFVIYFIGVFLQTAHTFEHYVQVTQRFWVGLPAAKSHGIIGQLDIEVVHLVWNISVLSFLFWAHYRFRLHVKDSEFRQIPMLWGISIFNVFFQSYHTFEHMVKYFQFTVMDIKPAPGVLGYWLINAFSIDAVIMMHFVINMIVYPLMLAFLMIYVLHHHATKIKLKDETNN